jgi:hypothetical protein
VLVMQPMGQPDVVPVNAPLVASVNQPAANEAAVATDTSSSYVVPTSTSAETAFIPSTRLTNYVVAHSEYSSQLGRRSVWSGVLADDAEAQALESGEGEVKISIGEEGVSER